MLRNLNVAICGWLLPRWGVVWEDGFFTSMKIGAIFDWDGVVVDSSGPHEESWERLAAEIGRPLPERHFERSFGMKNEVIIPELLCWTEDPEEIGRWSLRKEELYREIVAERGIEPLPGVKPFLERLAEAGISCVIGSSTQRLNITTTLERLGVASFFTDLVTAEDVSRGKPDPEVFQVCARRIGANPDECVVFEDAHVGIHAARAAGMRVVAVTSTHPRESLRGADRVVDRLDELEIDDLHALFHAHRM